METQAMQFKFRTKIILSISIILILALTAVIFSARFFIEQNIAGVIDLLINQEYNALDKVQKISVQKQVFQGAMLSGRRDLEGALLTYYSYLNLDPAEAEPNENGEPATKEFFIQSGKATVMDVVLTMLNQYAGLLDMDFFMLLDVNGEILFNQGLEAETTNASTLPVWQLTRQDANDSPFVYADKLYHGIVEPIYDLSNGPEKLPEYILGYIITGFQLDSNFIRETVSLDANEQFGGSDTGQIYISYISNEGNMLSSNINTTRDGDFADAMMEQFVLHKNNAGEKKEEITFAFEEEEMTGFYWKMMNATGETVAYQLILTSKTEATRLFLRSIINTIYIIGATTLLFGFIVGYFTSKSVTRPVDILVNAANELSNGNLEYPIQYQSKDEMGFLSKTMDMMRVSILKRIQQIQSLQDELIQKEKLASIGSVASAINHEIRNQLSFGMAAELIRQKHPNDSQVQTYTQMILDARDYILRMLDDIRNFARANQKVEYSREAKPLKETLERTIAFCRFDNELKHIEIEEDYADVGDVLCDHQRIGQVVINLIRNGGHAMDKEGTLHIRLKPHDDKVVIEVEDHGCGIPPENLEKIWESFFSTKGDKGLGLGLDICKKIIEDHQGKIYCKSVVGTGSTFFVELSMNAV